MVCPDVAGGHRGLQAPVGVPRRLVEAKQRAEEKQRWGGMDGMGGWVEACLDPPPMPRPAWQAVAFAQAAAPAGQTACQPSQQQLLLDCMSVAIHLQNRRSQTHVWAWANQRKMAGLMLAGMPSSRMFGSVSVMCPSTNDRLAGRPPFCCRPCSPTGRRISASICSTVRLLLAPGCAVAAAAAAAWPPPSPPGCCTSEPVLAHLVLPLPLRCRHIKLATNSHAPSEAISLGLLARGT